MFSVSQDILMFPVFQESFQKILFFEDLYKGFRISISWKYFFIDCSVNFSRHYSMRHWESTMQRLTLTMRHPTMRFCDFFARSVFGKVAQWKLYILTGELTKQRRIIDTSLTIKSQSLLQTAHNKYLSVICFIEFIADEERKILERYTFIESRKSPRKVVP